MSSSLHRDDVGKNPANLSDTSEDASSSDEELAQRPVPEPCRYYNKGSCRDGTKCRYLHLCKYALNGNCRYGPECRLRHPDKERQESSDRDGALQTAGATSAAPAEPKLSDGRHYQWQLQNGGSWKDVDNDHVIEAQYCQPQTKSIKIYNTAFGAVSIDFKRMRVEGKNLKVRRLDDGQTVWLWYCRFRDGWVQFGEKASKGKASPVHSCDIEQRFHTNPNGSYSFNIGADVIEIKFTEMIQVSSKKRKVARRPEFRAKHSSKGAAAAKAKSAGTKAGGRSGVWQFEGDCGKWHDFKTRRGTSTESSVTSSDIEQRYQQNPRGTMGFTVHGQPYQLDFGAMVQTNLKTRNRRNIRRL